MPNNRLNALSEGLAPQERRKMSGDFESLSRDLPRDRNDSQKRETYRKTEKNNEEQLRFDYALLPFSLRFFLRLRSIFQGSNILETFKKFQLKELLKKLLNEEYPLIKKSNQEIYLTTHLAGYLYDLLLPLRKCDFNFKLLEEKSDELARAFIDSELCENLNIGVQRFCQKDRLKKCLQRGETRENIFGAFKAELKRYCRMVGENLETEFTAHQAILYQISSFKNFDISKLLSFEPKSSHLLNEQQVFFKEIRISIDLKKSLNLFFEKIHEIGKIKKTQVNLGIFYEEEEQRRVAEQHLEGIRRTWNAMLDNLSLHDLQRFLTGKYYLEAPDLCLNLKNYSRGASEKLEKACYVKIESEFNELYLKEVKELRKDLQKLYFREQKLHLQFYNNTFSYESADNFQLLRTASHLRPKTMLSQFSHGHKITVLTLYTMHWLMPKLKGLEQTFQALFENQTAIRKQYNKIFLGLCKFGDFVRSFDGDFDTRRPKGLELKTLRLKAIEGELTELKDLELYIEKIDSEAAELYEEGKGYLEKLAIFFQKIQQICDNGQFNHSDQMNKFQEKIFRLEQSFKDIFFLLKTSDE